MVYNWSFYAYQQIGGVKSDIINNLFLHGPLYTGENDPIQVMPITTQGEGYPTGEASIYIDGNVASNFDPAGDDWRMVGRIDGENGSEQGELPQHYRRTVPMTDAGISIKADATDSLEFMLLDEVGGSHRLDCMGNWVINRDSVDQRILADFMNNTGSLVTTESDIGGWPESIPATPCADDDRDGMPNDWENRYELNPQDPSDSAADSDSDGFTNIEEYLNGLDPRKYREWEAPRHPINLRLLSR